MILYRQCFVLRSGVSPRGAWTTHYSQMLLLLLLLLILLLLLYV